MSNLSQIKRQRMLDFLETLKKEHTDDESIRAFTEIENQLRDKKYGLVWEEHSESVNEMLENNIPVFTEDASKKIKASEENNYNFILEGDNLQSLYLLEKTHRGKIDIIYIDPPYNTLKSGFTYNDRLVDTTDGYRHSKWLSFMHRRLVISRNLLAAKGVIFISIDNSELYNLKLLCDEVFGADNFVGNIVWRTTTDNNVSQITTEHEYIICYALDKNSLTKWVAKSPIIDEIQNKYENLRALHGSDNVKIQKELRSWIKANKEELKGFTHYDNVDDKGVFHDGDIANTVQGGYKYDVIHPVTGKPCKIPEKGFRFSEETMRTMLENDEIMFGSTESTLIKPKIRLQDNESPLRAYYYEDNRSATKSLEKIFNEKSRFSNPKSVNLLKLLFGYAADKSAIILDYFAGSGSTGEAVLEMNKEDGGNRKFILCTNNEISARNTVRYLHDQGYMNSYNPGERTNATTIQKHIDLFFEDKKDIYFKLFLSEDGKNQYANYGICRFVTYPRLSTIIKGTRPDGSKYSDGLSSNLKYFKCDWLPRRPEEYLLSNVLCLHIKEMIELQNGIEIDNIHHVLILNKSDLYNYVIRNSSCSQIQNIWLNQNIILNTEELKSLNDIGYKYIPKEFFGQELKEVAE